MIFNILKNPDSSKVAILPAIQGSFTPPLEGPMILRALIIHRIHKFSPALDSKTFRVMTTTTTMTFAVRPCLPPHRLRARAGGQGEARKVFATDEQRKKTGC